ncbi:DUF1360 domain-containing protein [Nocardioides dongxiaopingii]|uniref:DUF1360 domain-containing protein n=1 Tax=Nocardioides sp. S-1144 TaxID=2582905 RepID=UPI001652980E|nr:DUF1360 domain-containing protein [Nocardioides sp. S-1144]
MSPTPPQRDAVSLLVDALATYRLVKLVKDDKIAEPVRDRVVEAQGPPDRSKVSYLVHCPWCLSIYFGAAVTLARHRWPGPTALVSRSLALSSMAGLASLHLEKH